MAAKVLSILAGTALGIATALLCAYTYLVSLIGVGTGYGAPTTAAGWMRDVSQSAQSLLGASAVLTAGLVVACGVAIFGAWRRRTAATVLGIVCSILLAGALLVIASMRSELDALADRAIEAVGTAAAVEQAVREPVTPAPITISRARAAMLGMLDETINAVAAPVTSPDGSELVIDPGMLVAAPCGEVGTQFVLSVAFATPDPSGSTAGILAVWDAAGYQADRAMQQDVRYSDHLPVERMSLRDTSTIDGLIHVDLESACAVSTQ